MLWFRNGESGEGRGNNKRGKIYIDRREIKIEREAGRDYLRISPRRRTRREILGGKRRKEVGFSNKKIY